MATFSADPPLPTPSTRQAPLPIKAPTPQDQAKASELSKASRLARQAESVGDWESALDLWQYINKERPGDYSAYGGIKRSLVSLSRFEEALRFLDEALKSSSRGKLGVDPATIAADKIEVLFAAGRDNEAAAEIERQIASQKGYTNIYRNIANVLYSHRQGDDAVAMLKRGRAESGDPYLFAREIAQFAEARMDWNTAVTEYLIYLKEAPDRLSYVTGALGDIILEPGGDTLVNKAIELQFSTINPDQKDRFLELKAGLLFRTQNYRESLSAYKGLDKLRGGDGRVLLEIAERLTTEGQEILALEAYNEFLAGNPPKELYYKTLLGKLKTCETLGMIDSARTICEQALVPGAPINVLIEAHYRLGRYALASGESPEKARSHFESALKIARKTPPPAGLDLEDIQIDLALTFQLEGRLDLAEAELEKAVKTGGARALPVPRARLELARIAFRRGDLERAKNEADALLAADAASETGNEALELSARLEGLKEQPEALRILGQADLLALIGKNTESMMLLDSLIRDGSTGRIIEEALWDKHYLLVKNGESESALNVLDMVIDLGVEAIRRDKALFTAGKIAHNLLGDSARARAYYDILLNEHPDSPLVERARRLAKEVSPENL